MHERSMAEDLVKAAGMAVVGETFGRVKSMKVQVGSLSHIDPDSLHEQMVFWSQGTIVEGAAIHIDVVPTELGDRGATDVRLVSVDVVD